MFLKQHKDFSRLLFTFIIAIFSTNAMMSQSVGDFRSATSGNWATSSTWQTYNGASWVAATNYPGQNTGSYAVTIQLGDIVTIPATGISTQKMGTVYVHGKLFLQGDNSGVLFYLNSEKLIVLDGLTPDATIYFDKKSTLKLANDAVLKVWDGGLSWDNCNNVKEIQIGTVRYANCNGAPGSIFTFRELMDGGGTLDAISLVPPLSCEGSPISLTGDYEGAIGSAVTYQWSSTGPASLIFSPSSTSQNPTITPTVPGAYTIQLTVSTDKGGLIYSNTERTTLVVAPTNIIQNITRCAAELPYNWNGQIISAAGSYTFTTKNFLNCDSTTVLNLTVQQNATQTTDTTICESELPFNWNGMSYNSAQKDTVINGSGCGIISYLNLKVIPTKSSNSSITICQKELPFIWNGTPYTTDGNYSAYLANGGCDSIASVQLTVIPASTALISGDATVCQNDASPEITFTGFGGTPPYTFTFKINNGVNNTITTTTGNSVALPVPSGTAGTFVYTLIDVTDSKSCVNPQSGNATITVNAKPVTTEIYHQ